MWRAARRGKKPYPRENRVTYAAVGRIRSLDHQRKGIVNGLVSHDALVLNTDGVDQDWEICLEVVDLVENKRQRILKVA
jgi:hypothetical protein